MNFDTLFGHGSSQIQFLESAPKNATINSRKLELKVTVSRSHSMSWRAIEYFMCGKKRKPVHLKFKKKVIRIEKHPFFEKQTNFIS